jgi:hypothetical protein
MMTPPAFRLLAMVVSLFETGYLAAGPPQGPRTSPGTRTRPRLRQGN